MQNGVRIDEQQLDSGWMLGGSSDKGGDSDTGWMRGAMKVDEGEMDGGWMMEQLETGDVIPVQSPDISATRGGEATPDGLAVRKDSTTFTTPSTLAENSNNAVAVQAVHSQPVTSPTANIAPRLQDYRKEIRQLNQALTLERKNNTALQHDVAFIGHERDQHASRISELVADVLSLQRQFGTTELRVAGWERKYSAAVGERDEARREKDAWKVSFEALQVLQAEREDETAQSTVLDRSRGDVADVDADIMSAITAAQRQSLVAEYAVIYQNLTNTFAKEHESAANKYTELQERLEAAEKELEALRHGRDIRVSKSDGADSEESRLRAALEAVTAYGKDLEAKLEDSEVKRIMLANALQKARTSVAPRDPEQGSKGKTEDSVSTPSAVVSTACAKDATKSSTQRQTSGSANQKSNGSGKDQASMVKHVADNISSTLPKIDLQVRGCDEGFFKTLKDNRYIQDYDDTVYICFCQSTPTSGPMRARKPWDGKRGFSHLMSTGAGKPKVPYYGRHWVVHAASCPYLKVRYRFIPQLTLGLAGADPF